MFSYINGKRDAAYISALAASQMSYISLGDRRGVNEAKLRAYKLFVESYRSNENFSQGRTQKIEKTGWVAVISAKNHKRQSVTAKREKSQTPKVLTAILTLPYLT